jgi:hypothetical protein
MNTYGELYTACTFFNQTKFGCGRCSWRIPSRTERNESASNKIPCCETQTYLFEVLCPLLVCPVANTKVSKETSGSKRGTFQTHSNRRREYIQCPPWRRTLLRSLLELCFQIYSHLFINVNSIHICWPPTQLTFSNTCSIIRPVPKAWQGLLYTNSILDFFSSSSHLFMNKINVVWDSWGKEQIAFQRMKESLRQLMLQSSTSCLSKQEMSARKVMAFTSKFGLQMY